MIELLSDLVKGDLAIVGQMTKCKAFWDEFFAKNRKMKQSEMAEALSDAQNKLEYVFYPDRGRLKDLMALTAIASLYADDPGLSKNHDLERLTKRV